MGAAEIRRRDTFRAKIIQMILAGYSDARMAKETGLSYAHVSRIAAQEREAIERNALTKKEPTNDN